MQNAKGITDEMSDWFWERTHKHMQLVQKYCHKLEQKMEHVGGETFTGLYHRSLQHDQSKLREPEYTPYVYTTWWYKMKDTDTPYTIPEEIKTGCHEATVHHVRHNRHHPEFFGGWDRAAKIINKDNRDEKAEPVIAVDMEPLDIAEMCADWCAVSTERGNSPLDWAEDNVNKRWLFSDKQTVMIYGILHLLWNNTYKENLT